MNKPTKIQLKLLQFIMKFQKKNGYSPTLQDMASHFGKSNVNNYRQHVERMKTKGMITRDEKPYSGGLYRVVE